jgi:hypothetical protein
LAAIGLLTPSELLPHGASISRFSAVWTLPKSMAEHLVVFNLVLQQTAPNVIGFVSPL